MHSGVVWTMGRRGKKHTCLQINWFGQEASKEELCVVKQACGEAGMSQQKHHRDHREDHDAVLKDITRTHTHTHARLHIYKCTYAVLPALQILLKTSVFFRVLQRLHSNHYCQNPSVTLTEIVACLVSL